MPRGAHLLLEPCLRLEYALRRVELRAFSSFLRFVDRGFRGSLRVFNLLAGDLFLDHLRGSDVVVGLLANLLELRERGVARGGRVGDAHARGFLRGGHLRGCIRGDSIEFESSRLGRRLRFGPGGFRRLNPRVALRLDLLQRGL